MVRSAFEKSGICDAVKDVLPVQVDDMPDTGNAPVKCVMFDSLVKLFLFVRSKGGNLLRHQYYCITVWFISLLVNVYTVGGELLLPLPS